MFKNILINILATFVLIFFALPQVHSQVDGENVKGYQLTDLSELTSLHVIFEDYPITIDTLGTYPIKLSISGAIVDVSPGAPCGILCDCGVIQVDLDRCIPDYRPTCVFVAIPCFAGRKEEYLGKIVKIDLLKLELENSECFWNVISGNNINSEGIPYYYPVNFEYPLNLE